MKSCRLIINKFFYLVVKSWSFSKVFAIILVTFYFSNRQIKKGFTSFCWNQRFLLDIKTAFKLPIFKEAFYNYSQENSLYNLFVKNEPISS